MENSERWRHGLPRWASYVMGFGWVIVLAPHGATAGGGSSCACDGHVVSPPSQPFDFFDIFEVASCLNESNANEKCDINCDGRVD